MTRTVHLGKTMGGLALAFLLYHVAIRPLLFDPLPLADLINRTWFYFLGGFTVWYCGHKVHSDNRSASSKAATT